MSDDNDETLKALHDLAATCNDAAEGYAKAADDQQILQDCIASDTGTLKHYEHTLAQNLPPQYQISCGRADEEGTRGPCVSHEQGRSGRGPQRISFGAFAYVPA
jgi:hypothetical protein